MKSGRDVRHEFNPCLLTFFRDPPETTATAYTRATRVLWLDIIVTFTVLAAVASLL